MVTVDRRATTCRRTARGRRRAVVAFAVAALSALGVLVSTAPPSAAHAVLVRSSPAGRATVSAAPDRVDLWFNERIEAAFSTASVWNSAGARIDRQDVRVGPDDPRRLSVGVPGMEPGRYTVRYRVLSVDGHIAESDFTFTVRRPEGR
jgi:methionine-rich copper-binding protein CopC